MKLILGFNGLIFLSLLLFIFNLPKPETPSIDKASGIEIAGRITPENNILSENFSTKKGTLKTVWLHLTFENIQTKNTRNIPRLIFSLYDRNDTLVFSDQVSLANIKRNSFHSFNLKTPLEVAGEDLRYTLALERSNSSDNRVDLLKYSPEDTAYFEYAPSIRDILIKNPYLFLPSFLLVLLLISLLLIEFPSDRKYIVYSQRQIFYCFILPVLFANGLFFMTYVNHWAPIDELSHFQYIKTLTGGSLPTLYKDSGAKNLLEAFQPPLYYLVSTPFVFFFKSSSSEIAVRIWSVTIYLLFIVVSFEIYQMLLRKYETLNNNILMIFYALFVSLSPSLIVRSVCVSNGTFAALMVAIQALLLIRYLENKLTIKAPAVLGFTSALSLLSRFTNIFTIPIIAWAITVKEKTRIKSIAAFGLLILLMLAPWFLWNWSHYHSLTANKQAMEYQMQTVNPTGRIYGPDFIKSNSLFMFDTMSTPEEYGATPFTMTWYLIRMISFISIIAVMTAIILTAKNLKAAVDHENKYFTLVLLSGFAISNIAQQYAIVLLNNWPVLLGRYLHASLPFFAIFFIIFGSVLLKNRILTLATFSTLAFSMIILNINYLFIIISRFN